MRKRMLCGTLATALVMTAAGCAADPLAQDRLPEKKEETPVQRSETYPELWQEDGSLFDDFTNGVNPEIWTVPDTNGAPTTGECPAGTSATPRTAYWCWPPTATCTRATSWG